LTINFGIIMVATKKEKIKFFRNEARTMLDMASKSIESLIALSEIDNIEQSDVTDTFKNDIKRNIGTAMRFLVIAEEIEKSKR